MDPQTVICDVDLSGVLTELTSIGVQLMTANEYLYYQLNTLTIIIGIMSGLTAFLVGALLIVMVSVWRRS